MRRSKKRLDMAIKKTEQLPGHWFGDEVASIEDLPSIKEKKEKVRKNIFIDLEIVEFLEKKSEQHGVAFTGIVNDILRNFIENESKKSSKRGRQT